MSKKYLFSVVTPVHSVQWSVFQRTIQSMKAQTIGFENIEWIIVLHNSNKELVSSVRNALFTYDNVCIIEQYNSADTPSAPRNRGLENASSKYVGFLDADDTYYPDVIEKILHYMQKTGAQMIVFRRDYDLEKPELIPLTETAAYNQTYEEIVLDKKCDIRDEQYTDFPFFITSKAYDRQFLLDHGITFDETISMGEDCLFNLQVIENAERVCYLPQLIGYHYFIHSDSLLNGEKTEEEIERYVDGAIRIFDYAQEHGLYVNLIIRIFAEVICRFLTGQSISYELRLRVKEKLEPYLSRSRDIPSGRFSSAYTALLNTQYKNVILSLDDYQKKSFIECGDAILMQIIRKNEDTDFGRHYGFRSIRSKEDFQHLVPITDYPFYKSLIALQTRIGEKNIITNQYISWYVENAAGQLLPLTQRQANDFVKRICDLNTGKKSILFWNRRNVSSKIFHDGVPRSGLWEIMCFMATVNRIDRNVEPKWYSTSPMEIMFPPVKMDTSYAQALFALANDKVDQIVSPGNSDILWLFRFIEENWEQLCDDIENGSISRGEYLSSQKMLFPCYLKKDPQRAEELRRLFRNGFHKPVAPYIWKGLKRIVTACAGKYQRYIAELQQYTGEIPLWNGYLASCLGMIGESVEGSDRFRLLRDICFFEFLPDAADSEKEPVFANSVRPGAGYFLLITSPAGLYRYHSGIHIRIDSVVNGDIFFTVL